MGKVIHVRIKCQYPNGKWLTFNVRRKRKIDWNLRDEDGNRPVKTEVLGDRLTDAEREYLRLALDIRAR